MAKPTRLPNLQSHLSTTQLCLLTHAADVEYFTGFKHLVPEEREAVAFITPKETVLAKAAFSPFPPSSAIEVWEDCRPTALVQHLGKLQEKHGITQIFIDETDLRVNEYKVLQEMTGITLLPLDKNLIWQYRMIKESNELDTLKVASHIALQALELLPTFFVAGKTELELCNQLETTLRDLGAIGPAFPTIVAFGEHSALPHHQPGVTPLQPESCILIDLGANVGHYHSDFTRTWWFGQHPSTEFQRIEAGVQAAYQAGFTALQQNWSQGKYSITAQELDEVVRQVMRQHKLGEAFIHTTGHGVGLEIHEPPSLSWKNTQALQTNMVITIEPGAYFPGQLGYRHENTIWLSSNGPQVLGM